MDLDTQIIKEELGKFTGRLRQITIQQATVMVINDDDTIQVELLTGASITDVRLRSVVKNGDKVVITPAVGSSVLIGRIERSEEWVVVEREVITQVNYTIGPVVFTVNENGFLIQVGQDSLGSIMADFLNAIQALTVDTPSGASGVPNNITDFQSIATRLNNILPTS